MRRLDMKSGISLQYPPHARRDIVEVVKDGDSGDVEVDRYIWGEDVVQEVEAALVNGDGEGVDDLLDCDHVGGRLDGELCHKWRRELLTGGER